MVQTDKRTRLRLVSIKYGAITLTNLQNQLAYVWDALGRAVFIILIMFIFVQLWTAAYASQGATEIAGLTLADTIWYFLIAEMIELGKFRHDQQISNEVKDGSIAYTLNRPYNYLAYHFFNGLGETVVKMVLIFLLGLPIVLWYAGPPSISWQALPAVLLVVFLALVLDFCMASSIAFFFAARLQLLDWLFFFAVSIPSALIFVGFATIAGSLAFYMGNAQYASQQMTNAIITFSLYPHTLFSGASRFLLYTAIPAFFIGAVPVEIVKGREVPLLLALWGVVLLVWIITTAVFYHGLRRYESGSAFNVNV